MSEKKVVKVLLSQLEEALEERQSNDRRKQTLEETENDRRKNDRRDAQEDAWVIKRGFSPFFIAQEFARASGYDLPEQRLNAR